MDALPPIPVVYELVFAFAMGLAVGSFLNVLIHRIPLRASIVWPASHCPRCGRGIPWYENIPVLSWIRLRARCAGCGVPISARYPLVELLTAVLFTAIAVHVVGPVATIAWSAFAAILIALTFIDLDYFILPDLLTYPLAVLGVLFTAGWIGRPLGWVLFDAAVGPAFLLLLRWGYLRFRGMEGLGLGDVKLMAGVGAFLGWRGTLGTIFLGSVSGALVGLAVAGITGGNLRMRLPFGPFLAAGALTWMFLVFSGLDQLLLPPLPRGLWP